MTRSIAKFAATDARKQAIVTTTLQSRKITYGDSQIADRVSQNVSHGLKEKYVAGFNMLQIIARRVNEPQTHTDPPSSPLI